VRTRTAQRGQSLVELAIGTLVFVTVLLFGVHFAEVGFLSLKVQEAANTALWETTGARMHDTFAPTGPDWSLWKNGIGPAQARAQSMHRDFDALGDGNKTVTQVFTRGSDLRVECRPLVAADSVATLAPPALAANAFPAGDSGAFCSAEAVLTGMKLPQSFLDGSPFQAAHFVPVDMHICATGRAMSDQCTGGLSLLLDDWGFTGQAEARECGLAHNGAATCPNQPYYDMSKSVYDASLERFRFLGAGSRLASVVAGASPIDEDFFYMSFRGNEGEYGPFRESLLSSHGDLLWETTPWEDPGNYKNPLRTNCWLGLSCF
jgi:hypothetical protein